MALIIDCLWRPVRELVNAVIELRVGYLFVVWAATVLALWKFETSAPQLTALAPGWPDRSFVYLGMPGVGKTRHAHDTMHQAMRDTTQNSLFWVNGESETSINTDFNRIAKAVNASEVQLAAEDPATAIRIAVMDWLEKTDDEWMMIYDNVDDPDLMAKYLPPRNVAGVVIVTTRYRDVFHAVGAKYVVEWFDRHPDDIVEMLRQVYETCVLVDPDPKPYSSSWPRGFSKTMYLQPITSVANPFRSIEDDNALLELVALTDGLALAIQILGAYIWRNHLTVPEFLAQYKESPYEILETNAFPDILGSPARHTLNRLWSDPISKVEATSKGALLLLQVTSVLDPKDVPLNLFKLPSYIQWTDPQEQLREFYDLCANTSAVDQAVELLEAKSLIKRSETSISVHPLLQDVVFYNLSLSERQMMLDTATQLVYFKKPARKLIRRVGF